MLPWSGTLAGRIEERAITSEVLRGNPLADPHERPVLVYLPPGYDGEPDPQVPGRLREHGLTHSSVDYRYPLALAWLRDRIAG